MKKMKCNPKILTITFLTLFAFSAIFANLPLISAHEPPWTIVSYAYLTAAPNPVGLQQKVAIIMWVDWPLPDALEGNNIRRHNYTLTITTPDNSVLTEHWDEVSDPTGLQYIELRPNQLGDYTLKFDYGGQIYTWGNSQWTNDILTASSRTTTFTVLEDPVPSAISSYPLPTEYWTRPIEGQNTVWSTIASNWLGNPYILGANTPVGIPGAIQPDGSAPNSAHIMWSKPIQYGGVVGGSSTAIPGEMYYQGGSYETRFRNPIIMQGTLFYEDPYGNSGAGGDYVAVDMQTGKELWRIDPSATGIRLVPAFGYLYSFENPNQHGVLPNGLLIAPYRRSGINIWRAYDPMTGKLTNMNITNVPSNRNTGAGQPDQTNCQAAGPRGEYLVYVLDNKGDSTNPDWYLARWNSSRVFGGGAITDFGPISWYSGTIDASSSDYYDWNISISLPPGTWNIGTGGLRAAVPLISLDNIMLLRQGTFGGHANSFMSPVTTLPANITAISLNPQTMGDVLWTETYPPAPNNVTRTICTWDPDNGVFVFEDTETMVKHGYSLEDGSPLWDSIEIDDSSYTDWNYLSLDNDVVAYGNLYYTGYGGVLYCYNVTTGELKWTYGNGGEGNSTASGYITPYGRYNTFLTAIADGKVILATTEHSPNSPLYKGARYRCINATDGTEIWTLMGYGNYMYGALTPIADGYLTLANTYDMKVYCIGKGPSVTTVTAPKASIPLGSSLVIEGTVLDIAAGTQQNEQAARFPNGVPAVSDSSMSAWMEYVYMQKPMPTGTVGVDVLLSIRDPNGNYHDITVTTDSSGTYSLMWEPPVPGMYTIYAIFQGTEGYWPSQAQTAFGVGEAPSPGGPIETEPNTSPTPTPTESPSPSPTGSPSPSPSVTPAPFPLEVAIIAVIVVASGIGIVAYWFLRKR